MGELGWGTPLFFDLWMAGMAGKMLRGEIPYTKTVPVRVVGIDAENNLSADIRVFPDPSSRKLHVFLPQDLKQAYYEVYNTGGVRIKNGYFNNINSYIDMNNEARGTYILRVLTDITVYSTLFVVN